MKSHRVRSLKNGLLLLCFVVISCTQLKSRKYCEFDFFETTSSIKFPDTVDILNCYDDLEGTIWLHLKFEIETASDFILNNKLHPYSETIEDDTLKILGSEDSQLVEHVILFMDETVSSIPRDTSTYLKTVDTDHQYVIYILNKETGLFWGLIDYPE